MPIGSVFAGGGGRGSGRPPSRRLLGAARVVELGALGRGQRAGDGVRVGHAPLLLSRKTPDSEGAGLVGESPSRRAEVPGGKRRPVKCRGGGGGGLPPRRKAAPERHRGWAGGSCGLPVRSSRKPTRTVRVNGAVWKVPAWARGRLTRRELLPPAAGGGGRPVWRGVSGSDQHGHPMPFLRVREPARSRIGALSPSRAVLLIWKVRSGPALPVPWGLPAAGGSGSSRPECAVARFSKPSGPARPTGCGDARVVCGRGRDPTLRTVIDIKLST